MGLGACASAGAPESSSPAPVLAASQSADRSGQIIAAGDVSVLVSALPDGGMDALGGGRLQVVGGCLGTDGVVVVWPYGTQVVQDDPLTIETPEGATFSLGDDVRLGGGYVLEHSSDKAEPGPYPLGDITVPAKCAEHDIFVSHEFV